jgi:hypothetical protein
MLEARPMCPALFPSAAVPKPLSVNNRNLSSNLKMLLLVDGLAVYECYPLSSVFLSFCFSFALVFVFFSARGLCFGARRCVFLAVVLSSWGGAESSPWFFLTLVLS